MANGMQLKENAIQHLANMKEMREASEAKKAADERLKAAHEAEMRTDKLVREGIKERGASVVFIVEGHAFRLVNGYTLGEQLAVSPVQELV